MTKGVNNYSKGRLGDYIIFCDICGQPCWHSESVKLKPDTGRGGCIVCPADADPVDYGLVPYKIRPEKSPKEVRVNNLNDSTNITQSFDPIQDYQIQNPLSGDPPTSSSSGNILNWDNITYVTWDNWNTPWGN